MNLFTNDDDNIMFNSLVSRLLIKAIFGCSLNRSGSLQITDKMKTELLLLPFGRLWDLIFMLLLYCRDPIKQLLHLTLG